MPEARTPSSTTENILSANKSKDMLRFNFEFILKCKSCGHRSELACGQIGMAWDKGATSPRCSLKAQAQFGFLVFAGLSRTCTASVSPLLWELCFSINNYVAND